MHNFQNELQNLGMDSYQVGELTPMFLIATIGACLVLDVWRLWSLRWLWSLWRFWIVVEALVVVELFQML